MKIVDGTCMARGRLVANIPWSLTRPTFAVEDSYNTQITVDGQAYAVEIIDTAGQVSYELGACQGRVAV